MMQMVYSSFGFLFAQASLMIQELLAAPLCKAGVNAKQMGLMFIVRDNGGITQKNAGAMQRIDRTTMTQHVDALEKRGLLRRTPLAGDRRAHGLYLTEAGERTVVELLAALSEAQSAFFADLPPARVEELRELMIKLIKREDNLL